MDRRDRAGDADVDGEVRQRRRARGRIDRRRGARDDVFVMSVSRGRAVAGPPGRLGIALCHLHVASEMRQPDRRRAAEVDVGGVK